jgi:hypothetical protein
MPDRHYHGHLNGRVVAAREQRGSGTPAPGTPSRKEKGRESLAVQDPGLKDYVRTTSASTAISMDTPGAENGMGFHAVQEPTRVEERIRIGVHHIHWSNRSIHHLWNWRLTVGLSV